MENQTEPDEWVALIVTMATIGEQRCKWSMDEMDGDEC